MTQLITLSNMARLRARMGTTRSNLISSSDIISLANGILEECRNKMVEIESTLVVGTGSIVTAADTPYYTPSFTHTGFVQDAVFIHGYTTPLREVVEEEKVKYDVDNVTGPPEAYYLDASGLFYPLPVPDDAYTIDISYWLPLTKLTAIEAGGSDIPVNWHNIWDRYIEKRLEYDFRNMYERDISVVAMELVSIEAEAIMAVYRRGVRKRRNKSNFFTAEGV